MSSGLDPRTALVGTRRRARARLAGLTGDYAGIVEASRDSNADDEHDPERSTTAFERSRVGALVDVTRHQLAQIGAALPRVDDGSYGACEKCGRPVAPERLEARPFARTCIACAGLSRG